MQRSVTCRFAVGLSVVLLALAGLSRQGISAPLEAPVQMLAHDVYFTLKDNSPQAKEKLIAACQKYLSGHPGTVWFAVGPLVADLNRDVNDLGFDVALHVVFRNKTFHDQYQTAEKHLKFIAENKDNWKKVRVFDSYVAVPPQGAADGPT
jgi:hypothetical protein